MSYQWMKNGANISGATGSTYSILSVGPSDSAVYTVKISNAGGSVTSSGAVLRSFSPPGITTQPQSQATPVGQSAAFSVIPSGSAPFSYQWSFNGTNLSGATASSLQFNSVQTANAGSYNVVVSNPDGSTASSNATLTVYIPPTITSQPQSQLVAQHQAVSFSVLASGSAPFSYQWILAAHRWGRRPEFNVCAQRCWNRQGRQLHGGGGRSGRIGNECGRDADGGSRAGESRRSRRA